MQECDAVVPGERAIGERGRTDRQKPPAGRNRSDRFAQAGERKPVELPEQKPGRYGHRTEPNNRPCDVLNAPHAFLSARGGKLRSASPSLPEQGGEGKAVSWLRTCGTGEFRWLGR